MGIPRPGLLVDRIKSTVSLGLNGALNGIVHIQWYNVMDILNPAPHGATELGLRTQASGVL